MKTVDHPPTLEEDPPLIFQWERRTRAHWRLATLIALSLLIHAAGFYILQVAYTPTGSQLPPPVQVMMARADRPTDPPEIRSQSRALARWLTVNDPSLATQPTALASDRDPGDFVHYVPSYKAAPPPFKPLDPPSAGTAAPPRPRPPGPVPVVSANPSDPAPGESPPTRVVLTGGLAPLLPTPLPGVAFTAPAGTKTLAPTVFLVGVRPEGGAAFLFQEASSGEVSVDDYAREYLSRLRFQAPPVANDATLWGWAEFGWGRDAYRR